MGVIATFPDKYISMLATTLMLDSEISKLLYYKNVFDKDIFSLDEVENPIAEFKDKNVFLNRRVADVFGKVTNPELFIFINLYQDEPCSIGSGKSKFIDTLRLDLGVICNDSLRSILNGTREVIVADRMIRLLKETECLQGIGEPKISRTRQVYQIPYGYNAYIITVEVDYFNSW